MKALLVSSLHPDGKHISAVRAAQFAQGLSRRGHRVMLLTPPLRADDPPIPPDAIGDAIGSHDWTRPLVVCPPLVVSGLVALYRSPSLPAPLRRAMTAMLLVNGQGGNSELTAGARDYLAPIASHFGPDITWATFGEISNLSIAQAIARHCRVPWIMDIKDNWEIYVPAPLRGIVARRFRDAAAMTSNAAFHCRIAERAHNMPGHLIYSGVGEEMIAPAEAPRNEAKFRITITGGIYSTDLLADLLSGIQKWLLTRPQQEHGAIELSYAGNANRQFEAVAREVGLSCPTTIRDHLPLADLARMCQAASVNCYVWNRRTFHHKLLELLACSRPVITYPGESAESVELAREVGGRLITCDSAARLGEALDGVWHDWRSGRSLTSQVDTRAFSWDAAADKLEALMLDVLARRCSPTARHRAASGRAARE